MAAIPETRDDYRALYHVECAKRLSREAIINQMGDELDSLQELAGVVKDVLEDAKWTAPELAAAKMAEKWEPAVARRTGPCHQRP